MNTHDKIELPPNPITPILAALIDKASGAGTADTIWQLMQEFAYQAIEADRQHRDEPNAHIDDDAVDRFAAAMKEKLAQARAKGRHGWHECPPEDLSAMLRDHVEKGDPRDVANFCMFLWSLGHPITAAPVAQEPVSDSYVQMVPDRCDRIVWRGDYYHLPLRSVAQNRKDVRRREAQAVSDFMSQYAYDDDPGHCTLDWCDSDNVNALLDAIAAAHVAKGADHDCTRTL